MSTRWSDISSVRSSGRRADREACALRPVSVFAHHLASAPDLAGRGASGALDHSEHRVLLADGEGAGGVRRPRHAGAGHSVLVGARLRQPRRRVPADAGDGTPRRPRYGRAQQRPVRASPGDHRRRAAARLGVDGALREQHPQAQRGPALARRKASSAGPSTPSSRQPARGRAAGSAPACRRPGTRSICWRPQVPNMSATGPTTISPT